MAGPLAGPFAPISLSPVASSSVTFVSPGGAGVGQLVQAGAGGAGGAPQLYYSTPQGQLIAATTAQAQASLGPAVTAVATQQVRETHARTLRTMYSSHVDP